MVTIGLQGGRDTVSVAGSVFGAGKGVETHGYSALVRGNTTVTIQGKAKVGQSVYGGGEMASVGRYNVADSIYHVQHHDVAVGTPYSLANSGSGYCTVIVRDSAEIGPDNMVMYKANGEPDNAGHVFGAGKGVTPFLGYDAEHKPWRVTPKNAQEIYTDTLVYLKYVETLGLATQTSVTIGGHAFVKGDVFGGSEEGFVQHDTQVIIQDSCQIGNGHILLLAENGDTIANRGVNRRYTDEEWSEGKLMVNTETDTELKNIVTTNGCYSASLPECAHWPYGVKVTEGGVTKTIYAEYDKYANQTGDLEKYPDGTSTGHGRHKGSDGHTFFGNVFGGGSGFFPYAPGKWHHAAGSVGGNTLVEIKGGHILTNVYGGNELTDVGRENVDTVGTCTIRMTGGTIGVPRTLDQIDAHPVTCYLFGGGMGDPRAFFLKHTNVSNVDIELPDVTGKKVKLSEVEAASKVVLLYFWAATDEQKMFNLDVLKPVYEAYHGRGLDIFSVSLDIDKTDWARIVKNQKLPWVNVCDTRGISSPYLGFYRVEALPRIAFIVNGEIDVAPAIDGEASLRNYLESKL